MDRIRIAAEILAIAKDLLPRIRLTFTRRPKTEDRDLNSIQADIQRFVGTLRGNEDMECFVSRWDDGKTMQITVGFTNHEAMKGIVNGLGDMARKLAKKSDLKVVIEAYQTPETFQKPTPEN